MAFVVALLSIACVTPGVAPEVWDPIHSVGVAPSATPTAAKLWVFDAKAGAKQGAVKAMKVATVLTMGLWPLAFYGAGAVCVPAFGAAVGAMYGALKAPSEEEVRPVHDALFKEVLAACLVQKLQAELVSSASERFPDKEFVSVPAVVSEAEPQIAFEDRAFDAILVFHLAEVEVSGPFGTNPAGPLRLVGRLQLIRPHDAEPAFERKVSVAVASNERIGRWWPDEAGPADSDHRLAFALDMASEELARELTRSLTEATGGSDRSIDLEPEVRGVWIPAWTKAALAQVLEDARLSAAEVTHVEVRQLGATLQVAPESIEDPARFEATLDADPRVTHWSGPPETPAYVIELSPTPGSPHTQPTPGRAPTTGRVGLGSGHARTPQSSARRERVW